MPARREAPAGANSCCLRQLWPRLAHLGPASASAAVRLALHGFVQNAETHLAILSELEHRGAQIIPVGLDHGRTGSQHLKYRDLGRREPIQKPSRPPDRRGDVVRRRYGEVR